MKASRLCVWYTIHLRPNPKVLLNDFVDMLGLRAGCAWPLLLLLSSAGVAEPVDAAVELCTEELRFVLSCVLDDANRLESIPSFFSPVDEVLLTKSEEVRRPDLPDAFCSFFDMGLSKGAKDG